LTPAVFLLHLDLVPPSSEARKSNTVNQEKTRKRWKTGSDQSSKGEDIAELKMEIGKWLV
jgi:hypothetical protein